MVVHTDNAHMGLRGRLLVGTALSAAAEERSGSAPSGLDPPLFQSEYLTTASRAPDDVVAIPLVAGVLAPRVIALHHAVGGAAMSLSTIVVAINAQLLRGLRL
jgi:hypothetical protein